MESLMRKCNNYFYKWKESGSYVIVSNKIIGVKGKYAVGQYIRIINSFFNDGVHKVAKIEEDGIVIEGELADDMFVGVICGLGVPNEFIELANKIKAYDVEHKASDIISESVTGYSYSKATNSDGSVMRGLDVFKTDIKPFRRVSDGLRYVREV